jgi:putative phage-type endonuclease
MTAPHATAISYPDRDAWLEARRCGIGASDAAAILGVSPWKGPFGLYAEKLLLRPLAPEENEAMEWGTRLEPVVAAKYHEATGRELVDPGRFTIRYKRDSPFLQATLDREIVGDPRGPGVCEIKTANAFASDEWDDGDAPLPYLVQVQHQLAVTGYGWGSLAVLLGGQKFRSLDIERNEAFIERLLEIEAEFWGRLQRQEPPPVDGLPATADLLAELYPRDDGHVIELSEELLRYDKQLLEAKEAIKEAEASKVAAENQIKAALGTATKGILGPGVAYSWKTHQRVAYSVKETSFRVLRRVKV